MNATNSKGSEHGSLRKKNGKRMWKVRRTKKEEIHIYGCNRTHHA